MHQEDSDGQDLSQGIQWSVDISVEMAQKNSGGGPKGLDPIDRPPPIDPLRLDPCIHQSIQDSD
eukprot:1026104-Pelagomonas_calceolata.AAC.6